MVDADVVKIGMMMATVCLKIAGPSLLASLVVGVLVSLFQAIFQVQDQSLSMVPKFVVIGVALVVTIPYNTKVLTEFWTELMTMIPGLIS